MKNEIHPDYNYVIFRDKSANFAFLTRSTLKTDQKMVWEDGVEYPVFDVEISSASHPFYTGKQKILDAGGRVAKFEKRFGKKA
ncbi:MAG: type B 50S ribosomal protein L31 [Actinobacteria bacterium]|nr:type B 50S ribosomal protein L31 [Actinomycetota bacterium]